MLDRYANDVANVSPLQSFTAGTYLVQYDPDNPGARKSNATASNSSTSPYAGIVNLNTPYGISLIRILVQPSNGCATAVNALQDLFSITEIPGSSAAVAPPLNLSIFSDEALAPGLQNNF